MDGRHGAVPFPGVADRRLEGFGERGQRARNERIPGALASHNNRPAGGTYPLQRPVEVWRDVA